MGRPSDARERLIEAAIDLIWPASYGSVAVDAICEKAGVKKGSFYHFFESKDDLIVAALSAHWEQQKEALDRIFSPALPPLDRLRKYFAHVRERQLVVRKKYGRILGCFHNSLATECCSGPPAIAASVQEVLATYRRYLESTLRDAQAEGLMRRGDPAADAKTVFAFVAGTLGQARIHDDPQMLDDMAEKAFALLGITEPRRKKAVPA